MPLDARTKKRIAYHIENFNSPDITVSCRAEAYLLRHYGAKAIEPLLAVCDHLNPMVRLRSIWVLAHTKDPRLYDTILRACDDSDERVRYDAVIALGILDDPRGIEPLRRMYLENDETRPASYAFSKMGRKTVPILVEILAEGNADVRWSVVQTLGNFAEKFGDEHCIALLKAARKDSDADVRENAEFWLEEIGLKQAA